MIAFHRTKQNSTSTIGTNIKGAFYRLILMALTVIFCSESKTFMLFVSVRKRRHIKRGGQKSLRNLTVSTQQKLGLASNNNRLYVFIQTVLQNHLFLLGGGCCAIQLGRQFHWRPASQAAIEWGFMDILLALWLGSHVSSTTERERGRRQQIFYVADW